ncbi:Biotin synthase,biotin synthase,biotin synthase,Biotin and Thiamin Synthesis associated domain [Chlamydia serpentis]|uniref:Biotin synthase n=1 Tax=Chlamydia serpentis TaxID=1967782 RepID=A0A2R8FCK3_9CHLA|nr:biotin synthase BioB [Chlamydia serpentis]SPN74149.1 Biotin synthase,biotin synthase,biotin synthase,Biotin and Thiamin Synthesis associated domain [Chlamydia serpentis]
MSEEIRSWSLEDIHQIYQTPIFELIHKANTILRSNFPHSEVQTCYLISVKTGGCVEDCAYCAQSSRYQTHVKPEPMLKIVDVLDRAKRAIKLGATRICLGAAWRNVKDDRQFDRILTMIKGITDLGAEVCCALGMLSEGQAKKLYDAGLYAYNHNLDSSPEFYETIITTRSYEDRLNTIEIVNKSGISTCSGGIIGMGESEEDRIKLLHVLATRNHIPESIPINLLWPIDGTPLQDQPPISFWEVLKTIATTRIVFPKTMVRLAAGRAFLTIEQQTLSFLCGANSIFYGDKLLTVENSDVDEDAAMIKLLGLIPRPAFSVERGNPSCHANNS